MQGKLGRRFGPSFVVPPMVPELTRNWLPAWPETILIDVGEGTINGIHLGEPIDRLSWLGPSDPESDSICASTGHFTFAYSRLRLFVSGRLGRFTGLMVGGLTHNNHKPVPQWCNEIRWRNDGANCDLAACMAQAALRNQFGEPSHSWEDYVEGEDTYVRAGFRLEFGYIEKKLYRVELDADDSQSRE